MIKMGGETVLLYNLNNEKGRKIRFLLVRMGMRIRVVEKEDYGKPIGLLAGMKDVTLEDENAPVEDFQDEKMCIRDRLWHFRICLWSAGMRCLWR